MFAHIVIESSECWQEQPVMRIVLVVEIAMTFDGFEC